MKQKINLGEHIVQSTNILTLFPMNRKDFIYLCLRSNFSSRFRCIVPGTDFPDYVTNCIFVVALILTT